jgi:hypothetical protein
MITGDFGRVSSGDYSHSIRGDEVNMLVVAPPIFGRRRLPDGNAERRNSQVSGDGMVQDARERMEWATRCRSSPGIRRSAQARQRWPDGDDFVHGRGGGGRKKWLNSPYPGLPSLHASMR